MEGLIYGGKFAFEIDWASLIVGSKFTVFPLFYFVFVLYTGGVWYEHLSDM